MFLTFVYFLECTVVQCKDDLSIYWNRAMNAREYENYLPISRSFSADRNYSAILATLQITSYVDSRNSS